LQAVLHELERRFGPWIVYRLKDARPVVADPARAGRAISSGSLGLDLATGVGGFPRGRIAELVGPPSSGKSLLTFHLLANAQRQGGFVALVDAAHQAGFEQMARCGVDLADLFLVVPESVGEALEVAALLVESGGLDALVVGPLAELIGGSLAQARLAAEKIARLNAVLHASPTVVAFVTERGADPPGRPVGRALRHFATLRLQLTPLRPLVHPSGDVLGLRARVETIKNKLAPAPRQVELDLRRDRGIHREAELIDLGLAAGILEEHSLGICFARRVLGQGRARAIAALENDPTLARDLHARLVSSFQEGARADWLSLATPSPDPGRPAPPPHAPRPAAHRR
jgi:recombination protein RecA